MPSRYRISRARQGGMTVQAPDDANCTSERDSAQAELPKLSEFALYWQGIFSAAKDKAILELHRNGIPIYTIQDGKIVEVKLDL
ncbi:hypothetical protein [Azospirillum formosense]|uniref:hypothetical protein n=1 Tax=Azospirillum formosense TaxID=861533 RepID=UPI00338FA2EE